MHVIQGPSSVILSEAKNLMLRINSEKDLMHKKLDSSGIGPQNDRI